MSFASFAAAAEAVSTTPMGDDSQYTAPLLKVLPYLQAGLAFAYATTKSTAQLFRHIVLPIPLILYIIAPFTVFISYLGYIFIFAPYSTTVFLLDALHPLYVLCGVACLTGLLLGAVGRTAAALLVSSLLPLPPDAGLEVKKEEEDRTDI